MTNNILPSAFILLSLFSLIFVYPMIMLSFLINKLFKRFRTIKALDKISNFKQAVLIASILNLTLLNIFKKAWFLYPTFKELGKKEKTRENSCLGYADILIL